MLGFFRRSPAPQVPATVNPGRALAQVKHDKERARRRALCDQMRAELFAKGRADMTPIDWSAL